MLHPSKLAHIVVAPSREAAQAAALRFLRVFVYVFAGGEREYRVQLCSPFVVGGLLQTVWTDLAVLDEGVVAEDVTRDVDAALRSADYDVWRVEGLVVTGHFEAEDADDRAPVWS